MKLVDKVRSTVYHVKFKSSEYRDDCVSRIYSGNEFDMEEVSKYANEYGYDTVEVKKVYEDTEVFYIED
jgi:hypothetical protein